MVAIKKLILLLIIFLLTGCLKAGQKEVLTAEPEVYESAMEEGAKESMTFCAMGTEDKDNDSFCDKTSNDCDDTNPSINPSATEICDGEDNDCDGKIDEGCQESCVDECMPEGSRCVNTKLLRCENIDENLCLELVEIECTYGCENNECLKERPLDKYLPQSEILKRPPKRIPTDDNCTGQLIGLVEWNPEGSLCRRPGYNDASVGYVFIKDCCKRYYSRTTCTEDHGIIKRGLVARSQYYGIGCYTA